MSRPRYLNIAGIKCRVDYVKDLTDDDNDPVYGLCYGPEHLIKICTTKNETPERLKSVLFHEACHMALYVSGQSSLLKPDLEESIVTALENALRVWALSLNI